MNLYFTFQFCECLNLFSAPFGLRTFFNAYEVKNYCCLFQRLFEVKKNGVFLFEISFFVLEIFTFFYYANEGSDDVINRFT